jgi:hypothetical protein
MGNVGIADRIVRILASIFILSLVFVGPKTPWGWLGFIPLDTGLIGWCPVYTVLRVGTNRLPPRSRVPHSP